MSRFKSDRTFHVTRGDREPENGAAFIPKSGKIERKELHDSPEFEKEELAQIYVKRGLDHALALQVAEQLMARDALAASCSG